LLRIQTLIVSAGYEFPTLQGVHGEQVEDAVETLLGEYRRLSDSSKHALQSLVETRDAIKQYQAQAATLKTIDAELLTTKNALKKCHVELEDTRREVSDKQRSMLKAQTMLGEQRAKHGREMNELQSRIQQLQRDHTDQLRVEQNKFHNETENLKSGHAEQIRKAQSEESQRQQHEIKGLQQRLADEHGIWTAHVAAVKEEYKRRMEEAQPEFDRLWIAKEEEYIQRWMADRKTYEIKAVDYEVQIAQLRVKADETLRLCGHMQTEHANLREEHKRREQDSREREAHLMQKHALEIYQLRSANEDLKLALLEQTRPQRPKDRNTKALRDRDLTAQFAAVTRQVQDFADLEWDESCEATWPFSNAQLSEIHEANTRKLKKAIIQNTLWILLYKHVFQTPFTIMGVEGTSRASKAIVWANVRLQTLPVTSGLKFPRK
jgi:chromosome segregation ATPase